MQKTTFLLFFLICGIGHSQDIGAEDCPMQAQNKAWVMEYKTVENLTEQIDLVVRKIIIDAYNFDENLSTAALDSKITAERTMDLPRCSIRFGLVYGNKKGVILDLHRSPELEELIMDFTSDNIDKIDLNEYEEKNIYKAVDIKQYGVVLYTDNKEIKKKIRKLEKNKN